MSYHEVVNYIRNLFVPKSNKNTNNSLKRRSGEVSNHLGAAKVRKLHDDFHRDFKNLENFAMLGKKDENISRYPKLNITTTKVQPFADDEFSDEDCIEVFERRSHIPSNVLNRRPVLSEENYKRAPIIRNVPIEIEYEKKSNPPPLVDIKTGNLIRSTYMPLTYSLPSTSSLVKKSEPPPLIPNGFGKHSLNDKPDVRKSFKKKSEYYDGLQNGVYGNSENKIGSLVAKTKSFLSTSFNLADKKVYYDLLRTAAPSIYKNEKPLSNNQEPVVVEEIDLVNVKKPATKIKEVIDLDEEYNDENIHIDNRDEFADYIKKPDAWIDLTDNDMEISAGFDAISNKSTTQNRSKQKISSVEPVNTLKTRLSLKPKCSENWLSNFNNTYSEKYERTQREIVEQEENVKKLSEATAKEEKLLVQRLNNVILEAQPSVIIIEEEEEEEIEFPEFTQEDCALLKKVIYKDSLGEVLISKFNLNISRRDILTLVNDSWLNDEVINFYMNLLMERGDQKNTEGYPKVYAMNTFFIPRLLESGYSGVRRWTRKVDIFEYDVIPVPVHVGGVHWCMAIIHLKNKTIKYYDSMATPNPRILEILARYLREEAYDKKKVTLDTSQFTLESVADVPRQHNGSDCGVFSCMFAEYICRNKEITFNQQHMPYFRQKMILEIVRGKLML